jgi:Circularly permutated YpsA SLOG family
MRIVSGGQTGVDRAALDVALALGIAYGGWCPRGGWAEDLRLPPGLLARYPLLRETPASEPTQRTRWNVRDSDATLILVAGAPPAPASGTALTLAAAEERGRPVAVVDLDTTGARERAGALLAGVPSAGTLNVAGPRESGAPGIYAQTRELLAELLQGR